MKCNCCGKDAIYRCSICEKSVCKNHAILRTICPLCLKRNVVEYTSSRVTLDEERNAIRGFVKRFWGEEEQLTFDRRVIVAELPAYVVRAENDIVGFISFTEADDALIIVALGILPKYQNSGIGSDLVAKVETEARKLRKKKLLVSTSNDDLPALAFYQSLGFQIFEVKPNVIAKKHGEIIEGIGGLPVRDELRLQKILR
jgi:ribosomal protein S18 acetylase RimI-like enzyme